MISEAATCFLYSLGLKSKNEMTERNELGQRGVVVFTRWCRASFPSGAKLQARACDFLSTGRRYFAMKILD